MLTHTVELFENMHFYCTYSIKPKILSMLGTGYFLKIAKIYSQKEKPISPDRKNWFPQNNNKKKHQSEKKKETLAKISCHAVLSNHLDRTSLVSDA